MSIIFGSARSDENGRATGGKAGDQTGREVSTQSVYKHSKGWYVYRPKDGAKANKMAAEMLRACANNHIGYDQNERTTLMSQIKSKGLTTLQDVSANCETDCAQLVRAIVYVVYGIDLNIYASGGNFYTGNEPEALAKTGLFNRVEFGMTTVKNGDILVTKTKGHTGIICSGAPRTDVSASAPVTSPVASGGSKTMVTVELSTLCKDVACGEVKTLQRLLNSMDYNCGIVDGDFGKKTDAAVRAYQRDHRLDSDGIVGRATWKSLLNV